MRQDIILLIGLVSHLLHHLAAHYVHVIRRWRRDLRNLRKRVLRSLVLLTLPVHGVGAAIAWLTLFAGS